MDMQLFSLIEKLIWLSFGMAMVNIVVISECDNGGSRYPLLKEIAVAGHKLSFVASVVTFVVACVIMLVRF